MIPSNLTSATQGKSWHHILLKICRIPPQRELKMIIDKIEDKTRVGVCIDTCHAMAAGYDLSQQSGFDQMLSDLGEQIGFEYLVAMHLNDSKGAAGCRLDRHENIGKGKIGLEGFRRVMNCRGAIHQFLK